MVSIEWCVDWTIIIIDTVVLFILYRIVRITFHNNLRIKLKVTAVSTTIRYCHCSVVIALDT